MIYDDIITIGPCCITAKLLQIVKHLNWHCNQDFIFHHKQYYNINSTIFFVRHIFEIEPKFYYDIGYQNKNMLNNTVDLTYYNFDFSNFGINRGDNIKVNWHFGSYKKFHIDATISTNVLVDELIKNNKLVTDKFYQEQEEFKNYYNINRNKKILFVRLEDVVERIERGRTLNAKYEELQSTIRMLFPYSELLILVPQSYNIFFNKLTSYKMLYYHDSIKDKIFNWSLYNNKTMPVYILQYLDDLLKHIKLDQ